MTETRKRRRANRYVLLRVDHETPLTPDIVEMRVGDIDALFASRRVAIYYTTSMPWEDN